MTLAPAGDYLRPPSALDPSAPLAKDWLHVNLFDHRSGAVGIFNTSLHGDVSRGRGLAVGSCLVHVPGAGWAGGVEVRDVADVSLDPGGVGMATTALALSGDGSVGVSLRHPEVRGRLEARPAASPIVVEDRLPFGSGWISWRAMARLEVNGWLDVQGAPIDVSRCSAYQDHNWGRWRWGDDAGWDWGAVLAPAPGPAIVAFRATRRVHRTADPVLSVHLPGRSVRFSGPSVEVVHGGNWNGEVHRVPGAAASLRSDRRRPALPATLRLRAGDGESAVEVELGVDGVAQIVCADPTVPGQAFIHELCGSAAYDVRLGRDRWQGTAPAVFEHVD